MTSRRALATLTLTVSAAATALASAAPATAGWIGDFLSPAFGTDCANWGAQTHATGETTAGTGTANSNLLGLPLGSPLNQCGGADLPAGNFIGTTQNQNAGPVPSFLGVPITGLP